MKHLIEARLGALQALQTAISSGLAEKLCLIVDLQGRLRVLAKFSDHQTPEQLKTKLDLDMAVKCEAFWANAIWFDREKTHSMGKASPAEVALFKSIWSQSKPEPVGQEKTFTLDRRYSKEAWFSTDIEPVWNTDGTMPPIVSFYSYKGGVGRTTALTALAIQCARAGKRILVLDFDLEAPGLGSVFPSGGTAPKVGIVDYLLEYPVVKDNFDVSEIPYEFADQKVINGGEPIHVAQAGLVDEWYLEKLGRLNYHSLSESMISDFSKDSALKSLLFKLRTHSKPDLILIDSRAGLHDLGGLTLSGMAHWHVLFGLDSDQSWLGLRVAVSRLGREQILNHKPQEDCLMVQTMVPPQTGKEDSTERFRSKSFDVFRDEYYDDPGNADAEWPLPDAKDSQAPHYAFPLVYDNRVMGYRSVDLVADYLCEGDFKTFGAALLQKLNIML